MFFNASLSITSDRFWAGLLYRTILAKKPTDWKELDMSFDTCFNVECLRFHEKNVAEKDGIFILLSVGQIEKN